LKGFGFLFILFLAASPGMAGPLLPGDPGFKTWAVVEGKSGGPLTRFAPDTSHEYDVLHYRYDLNFTGLSLPTPDNSLIGIAKVTALNLVSGATQFRLNLLRPATLSVDSILWAGSHLTYDPADTLNLNINLGRAVSLGETLVIAIHYHGQPENPTDPYKGWPYGYMGSTDTSWTHCFFSFDEPVGARSWLPCYDAPYDKATLEMYLTVPNAWPIGSNGLLRWTRDNGDGTTTWFWEQVQPIATYLVMVAASDSYAQFEQDSYNYQGPMKVHYFVNRRDSAHAQADFANLPDMIDWYSQRYGLYPFDKYGMAAVTSPFISGAMEHQTLTTIISYLITGDRRYELVWAHELAHMWWGDMVTLQDWPYIMLNEGFATFSAGSYYEHQAGWAGYQSYMKGLTDWYFREDSTLARYPIYNPPPAYLFGAAEYNKGAWVLHMLRYLLGDSTNFFTVMRDYGQDHKYRNATFADFQGQAEMVYGASLDWFFQEWIYSAGYPEYLWGWQVRDLGGGQFAADVSVRQMQIRQPTTTFTMPVEFTFWDSSDTSGTKRTYKAWVGQPLHRLTFTMGFRPDTLFFDRNNWILKTVRQAPYEAVEREEAQRPAPPALRREMRPNPVRGSGEVDYDLPYSGHVSLRIYNATGQLVRVLVDDEVPAGSHRARWDGKDEQGRSVSSGVYFYALETRTGSLRSKVVVVR